MCKIHAMYAIVLAGGEGRRLHPYTATKPKPLVEIAGKPMVQHIMEGLKRHGVSNFLMMEDHMADQIEDYFGDGSGLGINIEHIISELSDGSAGAIRKGLEALPDTEADCFIVTSDNMSNLNFTDLSKHHRDLWEKYGTGPLLTPACVPGRYGIVTHEGLYGRFETKAPVHAGFWMAQKELRNFLSAPSMVEQYQLPFGDIGNPFIHEGYWIDAGTPDDLKKATEDFHLWSHDFQEPTLPAQAIK